MGAAPTVDSTTVIGVWQRMTDEGLVQHIPTSRASDRDREWAVRNDENVIDDHDTTVAELPDGLYVIVSLDDGSPLVCGPHADLAAMEDWLVDHDEFTLLVKAGADPVVERLPNHLVERHTG